jgi:hypothetical protein
MPVTTVYLSRLIAVVALIIGATMLADKNSVVATIEHLGQDRTALLLLGLVRAIVGAVIVLIHNVWRCGLWPLVVTLTGWTMLVRGVMNLFLPPEVMGGLFAGAHVVDFYYLYAAIPLVLGAYLGLRGFSAAAPPFDAAFAPATPPSAAPPPAPKRRPRKRR